MKEAYILKRRKNIPPESKHGAHYCSIWCYSCGYLIKYIEQDGDVTKSITTDLSLQDNSPLISFFELDKLKVQHFWYNSLANIQVYLQVANRNICLLVSNMNNCYIRCKETIVEPKLFKQNHNKTLLELEF